jgi:Mrp family chromosome partitioning ATPase
VSKYYEAIRRGVHSQVSAGAAEPDTNREPAPHVPAQTGTGTLISLPVVHDLPRSVSREPGIQRMSERLAPLAVSNGPVRLLVSGCRPGDGASTVAAALAVDLSQRLFLRTLLVDAQVRHPSLQKFFSSLARDSAEAPDCEFKIRATGRPQLDLLSCSQAAGLEQSKFLDSFEGLTAQYPAVVIDLGVPRLDARMLAMARPHDPILLVVRYGHTEREELACTASALSAANRTIAGVILNATAKASEKPLLGWMSL